MRKYFRLIVVLALIFNLMISGSTLVFAENARKNRSFKKFKKEQKISNTCEEPSISAESAIVIDANSKMVLFSKNEKEQRSIASTTKIMTALLTLEHASKEDKQVTITDKMVPVEGSSMYLQVGDILPLSSLAKGMLTVSGNDAAHSAAIAIAEDLPSFAELMNKKAKRLGMNDTYFITPSGLDATDENGSHHSTAYDMALLGAAAISDNSFREISSKKRVKTPFINPPKNPNLRNENKLLKLCKGCIGIKTGFTKLAGRCLVSSAERDDIKLVTVTLNAKDDWNDHQRLFDYAFSKIKKVSLEDIGKVTLPVVGGAADKVDLFCFENAKAAIKKEETSPVEMYLEIPKFIYAPVKKNQIVGKAIYKTDDTVVYERNILASCEIQTEVSNKKFFGIF